MDFFPPRRSQPAAASGEGGVLARIEERLRDPRVLGQLAVLGALLVGALLIVQLPRPPLPVEKGQISTNPTLARVNFEYVDDGATSIVRGLVALRVPRIYTPDARKKIIPLRESLTALVAEVAKQPTLEQVPEARRTEWKIGPETFAAIKQALGDKPENLAAVQDAIAKALAALEDPARLAIVSEENMQREQERPAQFKELRDKLPPSATLAEMASILEEPPQEIIALVPQADASTPPKEVAIPLQGVLTTVDVDRIQREIKAALDTSLKPIFGEAGTAAITAVMAPRVGVTLAYDQAQTENHRADAKAAVSPVKVLHKAFTVLVEAGKEITEADIKLLEQEQEKYLAELGWFRIVLAWIGGAIILGLLIVLLAAYAARLQPNVGRSLPRTLILAALCLLVIGASKAVAQARGPAEFYTLLLAVSGMIVAVAYTEVFALAFSWSLVLLVALATRSRLDWAITAAVGTSIAILALGQINNRSKLVKVGALTGLAFFAARAALAFWRLDYPDVSAWTTLRTILWPSFLYFCVGVASGVVMLALLPLIERAFGVVTNISLLELCDVNQPALRRMALEAPGTYTHSLLIGTLAEAAAEAIGASGLLARVGAYFHDIGKASNPRYFGENWQDGRKVHDSLPPATSRSYIMDHVKDGLRLADQLGLPPIIKRFIAEHHGTSLMEQFYREAVRQAAAAGQKPPAEVEYRYAGPKPRSRETAIVMLADAVEGATRSLADRSAPKTSATVHDIIMKRLMDGQLDSSGLTLMDLRTIEDTLTKRLVSVYHSRPAYPADRRAAEAGTEGDGRTPGETRTMPRPQ